MEVSMTGSQTANLGNFNDTMKKVCPDLRLEDSRMHTKCCAMLPRSRAKANFYMNPEVKSEEIHSVNDAEQC